MESLTRFGRRAASFLTMKMTKYRMLFSMHLQYLFSRRTRRIFSETRHLVEDPPTSAINRELHERASKKAVEQFTLQKEEQIPPPYRPGVMWSNILESLATFRTWKESGSLAVLQDALLTFYRTDLVTAHSGDLYYWDILAGRVNLKLQVYMILTRFRELARENLLFPPGSISTTDIGQNMYVPADGQKLTFKILRHAYYLNRLMQLGLARNTPMVIGELGSGAGELTILTKKILPEVKYLCFDLPETLLTATYNILMTFPDLRIGLYSDFRTRHRITREDIALYDIILLPNWCIEWVDDDAIALFVNIGSLSEMDRPIIENYLRQIERTCSGYFYTVNRNISIPQYGAHDIPVCEFPFSPQSTLVSGQYDEAADRFHVRYGMDYRTNYWEFVFRV